MDARPRGRLLGARLGLGVALVDTPGAIAGFAARGLEPSRAAVWAAWTHGRAGRLLGARLGLGFLAGELARELPVAMRDVGA